MTFATPPGFCCLHVLSATRPVFGFRAALPSWTWTMLDVSKFSSPTLPCCLASCFSLATSLLEPASRGSVPRLRVEAPPGAWWSRVVGRLVMTLPLFWLAPLAKRLADGSQPFEAASPPRQMVEAPPGAWRSRVVDRLVRTLPAFWFEPLANRFAETFSASTAASPSTLKQMEEAPPGVWCGRAVGLSMPALPWLGCGPLVGRLADFLLARMSSG
mmetsp:Transcript_70822/g.195639  ORF Transcript_70822/g.195639 Transcript_70822/m.195639 type:complete len:215 (+) Transcript_70822:269-913(+)